MKYNTNESFNSLLKPFGSWFDAGSGVMKTDVKSNDNQYLLSIDLPGVNKSDIDISLSDGYLTIEAVRHSENADNNEKYNYVFRERTFGRMSRTFYVGDGISEDKIKAKYDNGILSVIVPKYTEEEKALKKISIE
jgi:HSP20 family molecular chaperone IbpA